MKTFSSAERFTINADCVNIRNPRDTSMTKNKAILLAVLLVALVVVSAGLLYGQTDKPPTSQIEILPQSSPMTFRLLIVLPASASPDLAQSVAAYVGGTVVTAVPELRVYSVEVAAHSREEVEVLIQYIKANSNFAGLEVTVDSPVITF